MIELRKFLLVGAVAALSACSNATGYSDPGATGTPGGLVTDQTSPAYFQQAIGDRVFFAVDQSNLSPDAQAVLTAQAEWLINNIDFSAVIEGHADERGTREYNLALGARRANAVREFLISRGVAGNRLQVVSYGKERPLEICSDEGCYSVNRRAVTVLSGGLMG